MERGEVGGREKLGAAAGATPARWGEVCRASGRAGTGPSATQSLAHVIREVRDGLAQLQRAAEKFEIERRSRRGCWPHGGGNHSRQRCIESCGVELVKNRTNCTDH